MVVKDMSRPGDTESRTLEEMEKETDALVLVSEVFIELNRLLVHHITNTLFRMETEIVGSLYVR